MSYEDFSEPVKCCTWLHTFPVKVPLHILTSTSLAVGHVKDIKMGYLEDKFEVFIIKTTKSILKIGIHRNRHNPGQRIPDEGYALKFFILITGFDEETQVAIMRHDTDKASANFEVNERVMEKATTSHVVFDAFVVVQMIEFKSLDKSDERKSRVDDCMAYVKSKIKKEEWKADLGCILRSPDLEDVFTGRFPLLFQRQILHAISHMVRNLATLSEYVKVKTIDKDALFPYIPAGQHLSYVGLSDQEELTMHEALDKYLHAHRLGLDIFKFAAHDIMMHILNTNTNVLDVFCAALMVHDEDLIEKAILCFLSRFHEIINSERFKFISDHKGCIARVMVHTVRVWVSNHDIYIPGWDQPAQPTTEL